MYPAEMVAPMKGELTEKGFNELFSNEDVDNALKAGYIRFVLY